MRLPLGADEVLRLTVWISHSEKTLQIADPGFNQERQEPLEQLGRDIRIPKGCVTLRHRNVKEAGQLK